jgi:uncharacterized protein
VEAGSPVRVVATKWGGRAHWEFDAVWLGRDEHGTWAGVSTGTVIARPGARVVAGQPQVVLFPDDRWYVATYYAGSGDPPCRIYVDIATVPRPEDGAMTSVDLDLDVIMGTSGRVWVDDEDEFAHHRVAWDYPEPVVTRALASCAAVEAAMTAGRPPFDGLTHQLWLAALGRLTLEA